VAECYGDLDDPGGVEVRKNVEVFALKPIAMVSLTWIVAKSLNAIIKLRIVTHSEQLAASPLEWLQRCEKPLALGVGSITMIWTLERTMVFWS
jgi:hypothetical protein